MLHLESRSEGADEVHYDLLGKPAPSGLQVLCPVCEGSGTLLSDPCPLCDGVRTELEEKSGLLGGANETCTPPGARSYFCEACSKELQSARSLAEHRLGRKHRNSCSHPALTGPGGKSKGNPLLTGPGRTPSAVRMLPLTEEELFANLLSGEYRQVVVCTGAGVSTAAGIPDFRSPGGLFEEIRSRFGASFPAVMSCPENLLSRHFVRQYPDVWRSEVEPWLQSRKWSTALPTAVHQFCAWLHRRGWLRRVYTQNVDGLHVRPELELPPESVVECHGAVRDGSVVLYGDGLPDRFYRCCHADFRQGRDSGVDLMLVLGTSLQVAPFCAVPNMAPRGCTRVLVNTPLVDCMTNNWSPRTLDDMWGCDSLGVSRAPPAASSTKIGGRLVQLRPLWLHRDGDRRWRQLLLETHCDSFVRHLFESSVAKAKGHSLAD